MVTISALVDRTSECMRRWLAALAGALATALLPVNSLHAQGSGAILLSYDAPAGCPEVGEFQRSVQQRSARIHFVDEGSHERELAIRVTRDGSFTAGELRLIERDGTLRQRSVRFTSCAEAVEGLALISTVSLDPQALTPVAEPPPADVEPPALPTPTPLSLTRSARTAPRHEQAKPAVPRTVDVSVGAAFNALFHALPAPALGGTLFVDVASSPRRLWSPLLRASVSHLERRGLAEAGGDANFSLSLGALSVCPARFGNARFGFRPCAFGSGGVLHAWASSTPEPRARNRPFLSWGGSAILLLNLTQHLDLTADSALGVTLIQDDFELGEARIWRTPALYYSTGLGARWRFE